MRAEDFSFSPATDVTFTEHGTPEQIAQLYAALAKAQGAFGPVHRSRTVTVKMREGGAYSFAYAPLEDLLAATRPALVANGLAVLTPIVRRDPRSALIVVYISHAGGAAMAFAFTFEPRPEVKDLGGQITYLRRYAYSAALNLAADDDEDDAPPEPAATTTVSQRPAKSTPSDDDMPSSSDIEKYDAGLATAKGLGIDTLPFERLPTMNRWQLRALAEQLSAEIAKVRKGATGAKHDPVR
jgi:hypothetical protein